MRHTAGRVVLLDILDVDAQRHPCRGGCTRVDRGRRDRATERNGERGAPTCPSPPQLSGPEATFHAADRTTDCPVRRGRDAPGRRRVAQLTSSGVGVRSAPSLASTALFVLRGGSGLMTMFRTKRTIVAVGGAALAGWLALGASAATVPNPCRSSGIDNLEGGGAERGDVEGEDQHAARRLAQADALHLHPWGSQLRSSSRRTNRQAGRAGGRGWSSRSRAG